MEIDFIRYCGTITYRTFKSSMLWILCVTDILSGQSFRNLFLKTEIFSGFTFCITAICKYKKIPNLGPINLTHVPVNLEIIFKK